MAVKVGGDFGSWVRERRLQAGLSLRGLAKYLGVSPTYWSMVESGKTSPPTADVLRKLVRVLMLPAYETYVRAKRVPEDWTDLFFKDRDLVVKTLGDFWSKL